MTFTTARELAEQAAQSAQLDNDPSDTQRLLALALAEFIVQTDRRLRSIETIVKGLEQKVARLQ